MRSATGILWCILVGLCTSCEWFTSWDTLTRQMVSEKVEGINWNQVDQFPLFDACDESEPREVQLQCFENTLVLHLNMTLQDFQFRSPEALRDTLFIDFVIDNQGVVSILSMDQNATVVRENPQFEGIVSRSLKSLPRLQPATKQGIPVATQYRLPLILNTDE
ncbi:hypothetical protein OZ410_02145 [Robiginitalea sp. M366]|uniref:hypothetical protein n=1 Tax=Robiginitalea aestuariiviva TaxID=3036903 RepID=UPI00240D74F9|nr:hypothetical protein [Robiginitalea aestuariiviva]MDG1571099.1 hypothetical protein [Robiginitalea aestuariiviva]